MRIPIIIIVALFIAVTFACGCLLCSGGGAFLWFTTAGTPQVTRPTLAPGPSPTRPPRVTVKPTVTPIRLATRVPASPRPATPVPTRPAPATPTGGATGLAAETERLLWQTDLPQRDIYELATRYKGVPGPIKKVVNDTPPQWKVGDKATLWVHYYDPDRYGQVKATLRYVSPHVCAWVEDGQRVNDANLKKAVDLFEQKTYPTNREFFGSEWTPGVDNDPHIHVLNASIPNVGGYYSTSDEYPKSVDQYSNEHEMFYCNLGSAGPGEDYYNSTLAHEFQHMIHWYNDANEDGWVNEGFSELATQINGFDPGSAFYFQAIPDTQLNTWSEIEEAGPHYGASYMFMAYFLDRFGEETTKALVAEQKNGIAGFNAVLQPKGLTFDDVFADWVIANYLNDPALDDGRYGYKGVEIDAMRVTVASHDTYPVREQDDVHQYGTDYIQLTGQGNVTISFAGQTTAPVLGGGTHSGQYVWWGNRGDDSDTTMTREFDLTGLSQATLSFWTWYDIEKEWDFAYVSISADGGQTWTILRGPSTTDADPNGTSYGWGYTSKSGGGDEPGWIEETIDLTQYAGQKVRIRFESITDDALNYPGILIDDIRIPELGYTHDAEAGDDGWVGKGFARIANVLPQRYIVQVIEEGDETKVQRMELDADQRGQMTVILGGQEVTLVICGATPFSTEVAKYEYAVEPAR